MRYQEVAVEIGYLLIVNTITIIEDRKYKSFIKHMWRPQLTYVPTFGKRRAQA